MLAYVVYYEDVINDDGERCAEGIFSTYDAAVHYIEIICEAVEDADERTVLLNDKQRAELPGMWSEIEPLYDYEDEELYEDAEVIGHYTIEAWEMDRGFCE